MIKFSVTYRHCIRVLGSTVLIIGIIFGYQQCGSSVPVESSTEISFQSGKKVIVGAINGEVSFKIDDQIYFADNDSGKSAEDMPQSSALARFCVASELNDNEFIVSCGTDNETLYVATLPTVSASSIQAVKRGSCSIGSENFEARKIIFLNGKTALELVGLIGKEKIFAPLDEIGLTCSF